MHGRNPNVQKLAVHLPNHQTVTFSEEDNLYDIVNNETRYKTTLTAWFQENMNNIEAQNYKYTDFPVYYTWNVKLHKWNCATSFDNLKTVNKQICRTFKKACTCLRLLQNDNEWNTCLYKATLCKDILYDAQQLTPSQTIILNDTIENEVLNQIEHYLQSNGMSLKNFPHMPIPSIQNIHSNFANNNLDQLIYEERSYDTIYLTEQVRQNVPLLNKEQHSIYNKIIQAINNECENIITLPSDITIHKGTLTNLIDFVYPDLIENSGNANYMVSKAILTPKNINVEIISDIIMKRIPGEVILYPSANLVNLPDD
ncbi:18424_t:CDS:2, partial [Funneliformis geosporum]